MQYGVEVPEGHIVVPHCEGNARVLCINPAHCDLQSLDSVTREVSGGMMGDHELIKSAIWTFEGDNSLLGLKNYKSSIEGVESDDVGEYSEDESEEGGEDRGDFGVFSRCGGMEREWLQSIILDGSGF